MKFFRKADEMEMSINLKAMRLAWVFETIALLAWAVISQIKEDGNALIPVTIIAVQNAVFFGSQSYMTRKMARGSRDKNEE